MSSNTLTPTLPTTRSDFFERALDLSIAIFLWAFRIVVVLVVGTEVVVEVVLGVVVDVEVVLELVVEEVVVVLLGTVEEEVVVELVVVGGRVVVLDVVVLDVVVLEVVVDGIVDVVVGGTRTLLGLAAERGTRLLFASTSEVYGKNPSVPWNEDADRVLGPTSVDRWSYSSSKAVCEHMIYGMSRVKDLRFSIVRFFNVYGPRQNPIYVVSQSIYRALRGESPYLYDTGRQTRCFTYVDDLIQGIMAAATHPAALGGVFNLGNNQESAIGEVVRAVCAAAGLESPPITFDTTVEYGSVYEDIPRRIPGVQKAWDVLGWRATTPLAAGVHQTVEWARGHPWYLEARE